MNKRLRTPYLSLVFCLHAAACGSQSPTTLQPGAADDTNATTPAANNDTPATSSSTPPSAGGGTTVPVPTPKSFVVDSFENGFTPGTTNTLGGLRFDSSTMAAISATSGALRLSVPASQSSPAIWFEALDSAHYNVSNYTALVIEVSVPVNGSLQVSLAQSATDATAVANFSTVQLPFDQITGAPTTWTIPLSHFGLVDLTDVRGVVLSKFTSGADTELTSIKFVGLAGGSCEVAPAALTARLDLPDAKMGTVDATWDYDNFTYVTSNPLGAGAARSADDLALLQTLVQPAAGLFQGSTQLTGRPYAVSGQTSGTGFGDRIKITTNPNFAGPHTYNARMYLPLATNNQGGEKWVTSLFLNCSDCAPDSNGYKPELDIECHYGDYAPNGSTALRTAFNAASGTVMCEMHIQDGTDSGYAAHPMVVPGDAWHQMQIATSDNGSGKMVVAMKIDDQVVQWPAADGSDTSDVSVDTGMASWSSKTVQYPSETTSFHIEFGMEHSNWGGSQTSTDAQSAYLDWVTVD